MKSSSAFGFTRFTFIVCILLFSVAAIIVWLIFSTEPKAQKEGATKKSPMLVDVVSVTKANFTPTITAMGVVKPAQKITLKPQVSGRVVAVSESFVPGSFVKKGQWLAQLEKRDYELALEQAESRLAQAETALAIEKGEQVRARTAYNLHNKKVSAENEALILRKPQKRSAEAEVKAASSEVAEAKLALKRSLIVMPFDGQILTQSANLGSQVSLNDSIAEIVGTKKYWIESNIPLSQLKWLANFSGSGQQPSTVKIYHRTAWPTDAMRVGRLKQVIATLDETTRMARVLVEVDDPLVLENPNELKNKNPLIAGAYVETELPAKTLNDTVKLKLASLRKRDTVWVAKESKLDIREVEVLFRDAEFAYIGKGLNDGELVITSDLSRVKQGAEIRVKPSVTNLMNNQPNNFNSERISSTQSHHKKLTANAEMSGAK